MHGASVVNYAEMDAEMQEAVMVGRMQLVDAMVRQQEHRRFLRRKAAEEEIGAGSRRG